MRCELTGTNTPRTYPKIRAIIIYSYDLNVCRDAVYRVPTQHTIFLGGHGAEETPDPIPNSVVKLGHAYGTARAAVWESRSPPRSSTPPEQSGGVVFVGAIHESPGIGNRILFRFALF